MNEEENEFEMLEGMEEDAAEEVEDPTGQDNAYIHVEALDEEDLEEAAGYWVASMPADDGITLDWENTFPIEGIYPNTAIIRQAQVAVPKKMKDDPLLAMTEADGNVLRLCLRSIDGQAVEWRTLRGKGIDELLTYRQVQILSTYFGRMTAPTRDEVDAFLSTVRRGSRLKRKK